MSLSPKNRALIERVLPDPMSRMQIGDVTEIAFEDLDKLLDAARDEGAEEEARVWERDT